MNDNDQLKAIDNYEPRKPRKYELGGDYYYRCYWATCDEVVTKWDNFCRKCGQRIDWSEDD